MVTRSWKRSNTRGSTRSPVNLSAGSDSRAVAPDPGLDASACRPPAAHIEARSVDDFVFSAPGGGVLRNSNFRHHSEEVVLAPVRLRGPTFVNDGA
jgi:hypothetical protein